MKTFFYFVFCIVTFGILFLMDRNNSVQKIKKWYIILPPLIVVIFFILIGMVGKLVDIKWPKMMLDMVKSITIASFVLSVMLFIKTMIPLMLDIVISFHKTHNTRNLTRNPIKFFVEKRNLILTVFFVVTFLGSLVMYYGAFFGKK